MKVTRKFIANKANVSPTTVSNVINNDAGARIGEKTRKRVLEIAKQYNYFPNTLARSLVTKKTYNIGFISTERIYTFLQYPFNNAIFLGLETEIENSGYSLVFSFLKSLTEINFSIKKMIHGNFVDGVVLYGKVNQNLVNLLKNNSIHFVLIDYYLNDLVTNAVLPENYQGAYQATKYLINKNLKKIYCLSGNEGHPSYIERPAGYSKAMEENNLEVKILNVIPTIEDTYIFIKEMYQKNDLPEAFFAVGDPMAIGTLRALKDAGINVPGQVKVIGFDNISLSELETPKLTTVNVPQTQMGREAVKLLLEKIKTNAEPSIIRLPTELIIRESA